jgi:hypothetical protein
MKRRFRVTVETTAILEIDDKVFAAVDDDWRFRDNDDIAAHVGFNVLINNCKLTSIDGFAGLNDKLVSIVPQTLEQDSEAEPA